jgi:hypothetical protein
VSDAAVDRGRPGQNHSEFENDKLQTHLHAYGYDKMFGDILKAMWTLLQRFGHLLVL